MSLPYQIADRVEFDTLVCKGTDRSFCIVDGNDPRGNVLDVLIRSDPQNAAQPGYDGDAANVSAAATWIWVGDSNNQPFPLKAGESINFRVIRRSGLYVRGPIGHRVIVVAAKLDNV